MANENSSNIVPPTVVVPSGYSNSPLVGKIQQLYDANNNNLYKKLSPYTENSGLLSFGPRQPYVYVNPNQGRKGINGLKRFESRIFPFASTLQDTVRVSKFLISGNGILYITKQFLLQKSQAFNETRIYNPLSPILSVSTKINPFSDKNPLRHVDTSGGTLGTLASIVGVSALNKPTPPAGTVGTQALSSLNQNNSKGLIRAGTAISAYNSLSIKNPKSSKGGFLASLPIVSFAKSLFSGFGPLKHPGNATYRADEGAYGLFLNQTQKFSYYDKDNNPITWGKDYYLRFEAGKDTGKAKENIKKLGQTSISDNDKKIKIFGQSIPMKSQYFGSQLGYDIKDDTFGYKKYGSNIGKDRIDSTNNGSSTLEFSDILSIYKVYTSVAGTVENVKPVIKESKFIDKQRQSFKDVTENLKRVIEKNIKGAGYEFSPLSNDDLLVQQFSNGSFGGIDNITYLTKDPKSTGVTAENYSDSYSRSTRNNKQRIDRGKGIESNKPDRINTLSIMVKNFPGVSDSSILYNKPGKLSENVVTLEKYNPYKDDFIAFYFHDLVNDTYIPFRATVKGINESATANWSEISYIGRADKLFNYTGFSRSLSFNFKVVAMSIKELLPMWTRINYLVGLTKPTGYINDSSFIIPPLVNITIGDLYKEQPVVLKSVTISIPEDAIWELTPELNNASNAWKYLNDKIVWKDSGGKYAQFPTECDIQISTDILETERPRTGRRNFGGGSDSNGGFSRQLIVT